MAVIIDGKKIAEKVLSEVKKEVAEMKRKGKEITLAVVLVGKDPASLVYVSSKEKKCAEIGINSEKIELAENTSGEKLLSVVEKLNRDKKINGILVQFPLPKQIEERKIRNAISPEKDVDGLNEKNMGKLANGEEMLAPCTPKGVIRLLEEYGVNVSGKNAVVVGRSALVGKPLAQMLLNRNATVTICHSKTPKDEMEKYCKNADILCVAVGKPKMITEGMVKDGAVVIDIGINRLEGRTVREEAEGTEKIVRKNVLVGDVDFENVKRKAKLITPVPGGVGLMTIAMLMRNTLNAANMQNRG